MSNTDTSEYDGRVRACLNVGRTMKSSNWAITFLDETYGTIVAVKHKHGVNELPLCDLKATEAGTETRQLVEDYAVWFANR